jgi:hypothetical protein
MKHKIIKKGCLSSNRTTDKKPSRTPNMTWPTGNQNGRNVITNYSKWEIIETYYGINAYITKCVLKLFYRIIHLKYLKVILE